MDLDLTNLSKKDYESFVGELCNRFPGRVVMETKTYNNKNAGKYWFIQLKTSWDKDSSLSYKDDDSIHYEVIYDTVEDNGKYANEGVRVELHLEWNDEKRESKLFEYLREEIDKSGNPSESKWERWAYSRDGSHRYIAARNIEKYQEVVNGFNELIETFDEIILKYKKMETILESVRLLERKRNLILAGAPGVGKTYNTAEIALKVLGEDVDFDKHDEVMSQYKALQAQKRIFFTTFHQSMDYEDFVEGMKPNFKGGVVSYDIEDGIFKRACKAAEKQKVVLIIDEINRGNVSKIFGELITLIEADKRENGEHPIEAILPYSGDPFVVPSELYIIGTMNTTDRSTGTLDYALRRRFAFYTLKSDINVVKDHYPSNDELGGKAVALFENIEKFIKSNSCGDYDVDDLMVGHSYFMAKDEGELRDKMKYEVIPLIKEYMNDGILNVNKEEAEKVFEEWKNLKTDK